MGTNGYRKIEVVPLAGALGAEISGVSLAEPLADEVVAEIHAAWLQHCVIFFREQTITPAHQVAFARHFGELDTYPFIKPLPGHPEVIPIIKEPDNRYNFGGGWHSDTSYVKCPPKATMLYAIEVPATAGDTLYANMYAAYEALSPGLRRLLDGLVGVFTPAKVHGAGGFYQNADHAMEKQQGVDPQQRVEHPIVRTHPETGRKALYANGGHALRFRDMTIDESAPLLNYLFAHATRPEFTCRFRWEPGSIALWDNRCTQHNPVNDYHGFRRVMHRVTLKGDVPR
jgi:taurine dioxygenase